MERNWTGKGHVPLFGLIKNRWNRAVSNGMHSISFHHFTLFFVPSDLGGMTKLLYSITNYPNKEMTYCVIPLCSFTLRSIFIIVSKHSLRVFLDWWNTMEWSGIKWNKIMFHHSNWLKKRMKWRGKKWNAFHSIIFFILRFMRNDKITLFHHAVSK